MTYGGVFTDGARECIDRLLCRDVPARVSNASELHGMAFFGDLDWENLGRKPAPWIPILGPGGRVTG